uniref:Glycerate dehydrogenase n=1 Tax=Candidatus Kentrum sp. TUN TaxID=2126343 RepID=A0A451AFT0_9GAMM|nr:MAG: glycerate dehydrogenase [Candidatus Kentron sp. TUN]VFK62088.1 MAG: glycerate dehydrogenase [Candidatus Kentron sp. TUN]VFK64910.1 MAG: glycerate dehydrogenase [Candidatus Kentron sp. TUN]
MACSIRGDKRLKMRIVVLDGYTLNPGDLSWTDLQSLGDCDIYARTTIDETIHRARDAAIILTNKTILNRDIITQLPHLKYIGVLATGYNVVDTEAAARHKIPVTNVPEYGTKSVSQMVFAHVLNFCNRVTPHSESVHRGNWSRSEDFCFQEYPLIELFGKTMGVVGLGRIGMAVATNAIAFGMDVLAYNPSTPAHTQTDIVLTDLETVFRKSDIVTLHCPLSEHNRGFVNAELIGKMKPSAFLINTSRGPLIDEDALADALNKERLAGAGLDVLAKEPPTPDCPLLTAKNCFITPHIAWATHAARARLMKAVIDNLKGFLRGEELNVVNGVRIENPFSP